MYKNNQIRGIVTYFLILESHTVNYLLDHSSETSVSIQEGRHSVFHLQQIGLVELVWNGVSNYVFRIEPSVALFPHASINLASRYQERDY